MSSTTPRTQKKGPQNRALHDMKVMESSPSVRRAVAHKSMQFFSKFYFSHYFSHPFALFHKEIFHFAENESIPLLTVMAFRWSGKSTLLGTIFPLWTIMGSQQKKFVVIVAQTQSQAQQYLKNIIEELTNNHTLRKDLWPFKSEEWEWNARSIVLTKFGAKVSVISADQAVRGIRHKNHRPDLIIADDLEDLQSVRTRESRDKIFEWFTKELIPLGTIEKTRTIVIGNYLHRDSLLSRLEEQIQKWDRSWVFKRYPLIDSTWECLWSERYGPEELQALRKSVGSELAWRTEYLLEQAWSDGQIIAPEWIQWVDALPIPVGERVIEKWFPSGYHLVDSSEPFVVYLCTGVDLAISESNHADYTAFVTWVVVWRRENRCYYIIDAWKGRTNFTETIRQLHVYNKKIRDQEMCGHHKVFVENVAYQKAFEQQIRQEWGIDINWVKPEGSKADRLLMVSGLLQRGKVFFVRNSACEDVVEQVLGFWKEKHDDLVDAFTMAMLKMLEYQDHFFYI